MITLLAILLCLIFFALGGFHFYWLFGGTYGLKKVIPTKNANSANTLAIPPVATLIVALALTSFGIMYLVKVELLFIPLPRWVIGYGTWFVPSIFILRAIGEFNFVGFFKRVKDTEFAKADSTLFSPLCLGIGVVGMIIQVMTAS